jgi:hypothetical protein
MTKTSNEKMDLIHVPSINPPYCSVTHPNSDGKGVMVVKEKKIF